MSLIETVASFAAPQAAVPLRLLSWARGGANWLGAHPMTAIALLAAAYAGIEHHEAGKWAGVARQRGAALAAVQSANARTIEQAIAAKDTRDALDTKLAADGDRTAADLRNNYHAAVMQLAAAQDRARRADLPDDADAAASGDRSGASSGVSAESPVAEAAVSAPLVIGRDDAVICADNTARLQAVHDWAVALGE